MCRDVCMRGSGRKGDCELQPCFVGVQTTPGEARVFVGRDPARDLIHGFGNVQHDGDTCRTMPGEAGSGLHLARTGGAYSARGHRRDYVFGTARTIKRSEFTIVGAVR